MKSMAYTKHKDISLKNHPEFNEKWLQERIAEDPTILGLGDIILLDQERTQERAGRLDILLSTPEQDRRYEVELMLGATDESHIVRCIEYWDIERRRYPGYEHCAVLVAEDITSRFLNASCPKTRMNSRPASAAHCQKLADAGALVNRCVKKFRQQQPSTTPLPSLHLRIERPSKPLASAPVR